MNGQDSDIPERANENEDSMERRLGRKRKREEHDGNANPLKHSFIPPHPLLNDLVLDALFKFVRKDDLLACRLVCKKWNVLSLPSVRSKFCIEIVRSRSPFGQSRGIANFMKLFCSNTLGFPFEKFSLGSFETTKGYTQKFIQFWGPTVKQIILEDDHFHSSHGIENISNLLRSTQNLVSFTMPLNMCSKNGNTVKLFDNTCPKPTLPFLKFLDVSCEWGNGHRKKLCPTFYEELFEVAPNISTLALDTNSQTPSSALEVLETIKKLGREKSIQNLALPHLMTAQLDFFRSMLLPTPTSEWNLKQLVLTDDGHHGQINEFRGFELIKIFKNTLIALRLNSNHGRRTQNPALITFVDKMPQLKFLQLRLNWEVSLKCESYNNIFPALEKIDIDYNIGNYDGDQTNNNILIGDQPCTIPALKSSIIRCLPITIQRLDRILRIFPTLTILKCMVTPQDGVEVIRAIWTRMRMAQLEGLHLYGELPAGVNMNSLVTGIPAKEIKMNMMEDFFKSIEPLNINARREKFYTERNKYRDYNLGVRSIRNLTNLKSLRLKLSGELGGRMSDMYLTDVTGYFALYSLQNLQHLSVSDCEISKSCAQILVKDKDLMTWKFRSSVFEDIIPGFGQHRITDNLSQDTFPLLKM